MIVNAARTVDKTRFVHKLKGLRAEQALEQDLYPGRSKTGQKPDAAKMDWFRTFVPVDMHGLVHSGVKKIALGQFSRVEGIGP